jgi:hypothetical protein
MYDKYLNNARRYISGMYGVTFPFAGKTYTLKNDTIAYKAGSNNNLVPAKTMPAGSQILINNIAQDPAGTGKNYAVFTDDGTAYYIDYNAFNPVAVDDLTTTDENNSRNMNDPSVVNVTPAHNTGNGASMHKSWLNAFLPGNKGKTGINWLLIDLAVIAAGAIVIKKVSKHKPKNPNYIVLKP